MYYYLLILLFCLPFLAKAQVQKKQSLVQLFDQPPMSAKPSCFWWWFNSLVDKEGITRDLEEFKAKGMGGVTLICTGNDYGIAPMPRGPVFLSAEWRKLYKHAVNECARLGLELGVNFCGGGWCMGGSWIKPEFSSRWYVQSTISVTGPKKMTSPLPVPGYRDGYDKPYFGNVNHYMTWPEEKADYHDTKVLAFKEDEGGGSNIGSVRGEHLAAKSNRKDGSIGISSQKIMDQTLVPWISLNGDNPIKPESVIDLTSKLRSDGMLDWDIPPGRWTIQRIGHVLIGCDVRCVLPEVGYVLEIDWLNGDAVDEMFTNLGKILIEDAGAHTGKTLKFLHTDSFEDGFPNWTGDILNKFKHYRGYDPTPYLPVLAGKLVGSAEISDRFLYDYRKTVSDCMADGSYGRLAERAREHGLEIQSEAAGPSWSGTVCMDGLKNLGRCERPMGEFWQNGTLTQGGQNKAGKQTATAAHIYGRRTASAESFTNLSNQHWTDAPSVLKPVADRAFCEGINRIVFHTMTSTRPQDGLPGYEYGAGTHFNPNVTWWQQAAGSWLSYINRCQTLLQSGLFVADVLYYNGDWAPNLVDVKHIDPSLGKGYDYDVCNAEVLLTRLGVKDGRITLPDGMSYRLLVLPTSKNMPVEVIRKIQKLVEAGATVVGPKPERDPGLLNYPQCDEEVKKTADYLWGDHKSGIITDRKVGKGRLIAGKTLREVLLSYRIAPDFEVIDSDSSTFIDYIHRTTPEAEIYFLANRNNLSLITKVTFRVNGRTPELWDPINGKKQKLPEFSSRNGRTSIPLEFKPFESMFIIFPKVKSTELVHREENFVHLKPFFEVTGAWTVQFIKEWLYPDDGLNKEQSDGLFRFNDLEDWSKRPEEVLRYYSGTATYKKIFNISGLSFPNKKEVFLDLGTVKESARVRLNGKDLGVVWCNPWQVDISGILKAGENNLEIEVVNLWPNRLIGDSRLPEEKRKTRTNVISYKPDSPLLSSGLIGPVTIQVHEKAMSDNYHKIGK